MALIGTADSIGSIFKHAAVIGIAIWLGSSVSAQDVPQGGTLVFAHEQEPGTLNVLHPSGVSGGNAATAGPMNSSTYKFPPSGDPIPFLLAKEAEIGTDPFTVTYTIRDDATWSDGTPITAADFVFTYETIVDPQWTIAVRQPYDLITEVEVIDDKTVRFTFSENVPTYKQLFPTVLPKHDLEGKDWDTAWQDDRPVTNGPFVLERWDRGQQMVYAPNPYFWAEGPHVDQLVIRFVGETNTLMELLRSGEVHAADPQPQPEIISALSSMEGFEIDAKTGLLFELLRFNYEVEPLDKLFVRQAIMMGIDREAVVGQMVKPIDPDATAPQSWVFPSSSPHFVPKYEKLAYNPEGAVKLLEDNGCAREADGVFACDGKRLEFDYLSTSGNERRELTFEIIQAYLSQIGIKMNADFAQASVQFGERGPKGDYEIFNHGGLYHNPIQLYLWSGCEGGRNSSGYCNENLDELLNRAMVEADEAELVKILNEIDTELADTLPIIPLFGLARMVVFNGNKVGGINVSPAAEGPIATGGWYWNWNANEFYLKN